MAFSYRLAFGVLSKTYIGLYKSHFTLFEENKMNDQRDCYDGNYQERKLETMLLAAPA